MKGCGLRFETRAVTTWHICGASGLLKYTFGGSLYRCPKLSCNIGTLSRNSTFCKVQRFFIQLYVYMLTHFIRRFFCFPAARQTKLRCMTCTDVMETKFCDTINECSSDQVLITVMLVFD